MFGIPWDFPLQFGSEGKVEDKKQTILDDFKALKLVCWDTNTQTVVYENWQTSFDTALDVYAQLIPADTDVTSSSKRQRPPDPARSDSKMDMLLERLRLSGSPEHVPSYSK
jgi:hypothetical protein